MDFDKKVGRLLFVHRGRDVQTVDVKDGNPIATHHFDVDEAAFAGAQGWIVALERPRNTTTKNAGRTLLIDPFTNQVRASLTSANRLNVLAVSPDRQLLAIAGYDQSVTMLDADTLTELRCFRADGGAIAALEFHPSKPILATGPADFGNKLWGNATAKLRQTFLGLDGCPVMLSFSPNGPPRHPMGWGSRFVSLISGDG